MKRLDFSNPVTRLLTPGSNDYTNPTRPSRHVTWTGGDHRGKLPGKSPASLINIVLFDGCVIKRNIRCYWIYFNARLDFIFIEDTKCNHCLNMSTHIDRIIAVCTNSMYPLRILRAHGLPQNILHQVTNAIIISRILYSTPAWWGSDQFLQQGQDRSSHEQPQEIWICC